MLDRASAVAEHPDSRAASRVRPRPANDMLLGIDRARPPSFLRFQFGFILRNERTNVVRHAQKLQPLLLVERHRKAPHSVDGHGAFFTDLHANALRSSFLQSRVLLPETFELSFHIIVGHGISFAPFHRGGPKPPDDRKYSRSGPRIGAKGSRS